MNQINSTYWKEMSHVYEFGVSWSVSCGGSGSSVPLKWVAGRGEHREVEKGRD